MGKFLAIFNGAAADQAEQSELTEQAQADFMTAWAAWAQAHRRALVDPGAPLFRKKKITASGVEESEDAKVAYAIIVAQSHDEAVGIFSAHPHLALLTGNSIEVIECPEIGGEHPPEEP